MTAGKTGARKRRARLAAIILTGMLPWPLGAPALADEYRLAADTRIQVAVVQWNPSKGEYQRWDALGGAFGVSPEGTIGLPVVGSLPVSDKTSTEVAAQISAALQEKMGLLSPPDVTVEIVQYPPIYVVGAVSAPGAYPFRPGLTVLQALAIAGGRYRLSADKTGQNPISLRGDLTTIRTDKLRLIGRIARLQAEFAGDPDIRFPPELTANPDSKLVAEVISLERTLFAARANETKRQLTTLAELRDMYLGEIQMLDGKSKEAGKEIAQTEEEVAGLTKLVEQGITTVSRWSELRRVLAQMRAAHSEDDIATMRARQNLSDATREEFGIHDQRHTEVATQLRDSQGELARLKSREATAQQLFLDDSDGTLGDTSKERPQLKFILVRQSQSVSPEFPASESTPLQPGDVLKVEVGNTTPTGMTADAADSATKTETPAPGATQ